MTGADHPPEVMAYLDRACAPRDGEKTSGERGLALRAVFDAVVTAMPPGYRLGIASNMIGWVIPLEDYPETYNGGPLLVTALAAQKNYDALYLMSLYSDPLRDAAFRAAWAATGRKLDMGKSCLRFRRLADVDLSLIADEIAGMPPSEFIARYEISRSR